MLRGGMPFGKVLIWCQKNFLSHTVDLRAETSIKILMLFCEILSVYHHHFYTLLSSSAYFNPLNGYFTTERSSKG